MPQKKSPQQPPTSVSSTSLSAPVQSLDDKIYQENMRIQAQAQKVTSDGQSSRQRFFSWLMARKVMTAAACLLIIGGTTTTAVVMQQIRTRDRLAQQSAPDGSTQPIETITFSSEDSTNEGSPSEGSESSSGSSDTSAEGTPTTLNVPASFTVKPQAYQLVANWQVVPGATQYRLEISLNTDFTQSRSITSGTTTVTIPGLEPATTYYIRLQSIGAQVTSSWTATQTVRTTVASGAVAHLPLPAQTAGLRGLVRSAHSVTLTWSKATGATRYTVIRAQDSKLGSHRKEYASTSGTAYTAADLQAGTVYYFVIKASNSRGFGPQSSIVSVKTQLATPIMKTVDILSSSSLRPTWLVSTGASQYHFRYATNSAMTNARQLILSSTTTTLSKLPSGTIYYLQVRAKDDRFLTGWSKVVAVRTALSPPSTLSVSATGTTSLKASWSKSTGSSQYSLRYSSASTMSGSVTKTVKATSIAIGNLRTQTKYYLQVRASDGRTSSSWSSVRSVSTLSPTASLTVASFNVLGASHTDPGGNKTGWDTGAERFPKAMKVIRDSGFDIVGLQEFQKSQRASFVKVGGSDWAIYPTTASYTRQFSTNSLIWKKSRFTLVAGGKREIRYFEGGTVYIPWVRLKDKVTNKTFYVSNTHDPSDTADHHEQEFYRMEDAKRHLQEAKNRIGMGWPVIMTGDFNSAFILRPMDNLFKGDRNKLTYCILTSSGQMLNSYDVVHNRSGKCPTKSGGTIDHVYVSKGIDATKWGQITGMAAQGISDHNPTYTKLLIR